MTEIVFATNNQNKIKEIEILLPPVFHIKKLIDIGCNEELPETHHTIEENSAEKAAYVFETYHVNCFSEDSGLEVEALNGEPGADSAHYAGDRDANKNMDKLLEHMQDKENRNAQFKTVITLILNGIQHQFTGILKGKIGTEKRGLYGFGYDPVFVLPDGRTLAELMLDEKSRISHRGIATKKLITFLTDLT
ncbi:MAG: RdgB/HAM1 family non-canonical purine NTP pyrophosphatase [Sphingobacteriales bacterium]|nr:RdgB/HAM1 family non-canonical purine NTP pyrophosphatase [Sphingobacteriales bacterium]MBP8192913.1 RdgB/HAM1 family non-canonical purine NTP pyrophosphatase [Chitinophagales bacterium]